MEKGPEDETGLMLLTLALFGYCIWILWKVYVG